MTYSMVFDLNLGSAGITDARAQLINTLGANVGSAASTGFVDVGSGFYQWLGTIPAGFAGGVKFYSAAAPTVILAFKSINLTPWEQSPRTLTQSAASTIATLAGSEITIMRGDSLDVSLTGLGSLSSYVSLDFTVKLHDNDTDDNAVLRIRKNASTTNDGLMRLNGAAPAGSVAATDGKLTIDDLGAGDITLTLIAADAATLPINDCLYDVQMITAAGVSTLTSGIFNVLADVTRAVT